MEPFRRQLGSDLAVVSTREAHAAQLEQLQRLVFPTLAESELFRAEHYLKHIALFPAGQYVVVTEGSPARVVGMTSTLRLGDSCLQPHTFAEVIDGGFLTSHDPHGPWLYGVDVGVHPEFRRRGLARALYAARHATVGRLGLAGQVTVGMLSGFGAVRHEVAIEDYYADVISGKRNDPTVTAQFRVGFGPRGIVRGYVDDPVCDGCGALLVLPAETDVPWPPNSGEAR